ncbi:MAG: flavin reductase family protein [bacterium]|nr:flavin reductase family protein [bacterium]
MQIDPAGLSGGRRYYLMCSVVIPRPIAWIGTVNVDGSNNLAPFSFFNAFSATPPIVGIGIAPHETKPEKDTLANLRRTGELSISLPTTAQIEQVADSSGDWDYGVDEFALTEMTPQICEKIAAPRVAESPVSLECTVWEIKPLGDAGSTLVLAEVQLLHINDTLLSEWGTVDSYRFDALSRLGGISYGAIGEKWDVTRGGGG